MKAIVILLDNGTSTVGILENPTSTKAYIPEKDISIEVKSIGIKQIKGKNIELFEEV